MVISILFSELSILSCVVVKIATGNISASCSPSVTILRHQKNGAPPIVQNMYKTMRFFFKINIHEFCTTYLSKIHQLSYISIQVLIHRDPGISSQIQLQLFKMPRAKKESQWILILQSDKNIFYSSQLETSLLFEDIFHVKWNMLATQTVRSPTTGASTVKQCSLNCVRPCADLGHVWSRSQLWGNKQAYVPV